MDTKSERNICVIIFITDSLPLHFVFCKALRAFKDRHLKITTMIIIILFMLVHVSVWCSSDFVWLLHTLYGCCIHCMVATCIR